jgi:hypothetical protein
MLLARRKRNFVEKGGLSHSCFLRILETQTFCRFPQFILVFRKGLILNTLLLLFGVANRFALEAEKINKKYFFNLCFKIQF